MYPTPVVVRPDPDAVMILLNLNSLFDLMVSSKKVPEFLIKEKVRLNGLRCICQPENGTPFPFLWTIGYRPGNIPGYGTFTFPGLSDLENFYYI